MISISSAASEKNSTRDPQDTPPHGWPPPTSVRPPRTCDGVDEKRILPNTIRLERFDGDAGRASPLGLVGMGESFGVVLATTLPERHDSVLLSREEARVLAAAPARVAQAAAANVRAYQPDIRACQPNI